MQPCYEFTVLLIIRHPNVDPELLTHELGLEPQYCWRAGDPRFSGAGGEPDGTYRESYWAAKFYPYPDSSPVPTFEALFEAFGPSPVIFAMPLETILTLGTLILKRRREFWERLQKEGASAEFFVSLANRDRVNLKLPTDLLATMASLGLSVSVDVQSYAQAAA